MMSLAAKLRNCTPPGEKPLSKLASCWGFQWMSDLTAQMHNCTLISISGMTGFRVKLLLRILFVSVFTRDLSKVRLERRIPSELTQCVSCNASAIKQVVPQPREIAEQVAVLLSGSFYGNSRSRNTITLLTKIIDSPGAPTPVPTAHKRLRVTSCNRTDIIITATVQSTMHCGPSRINLMRTISC